MKSHARPKYCQTLLVRCSVACSPLCCGGINGSLGVCVRNCHRITHRNACLNLWCVLHQCYPLLFPNLCLYRHHCVHVAWSIQYILLCACVWFRLKLSVLLHVHHSVHASAACVVFWILFSAFAPVIECVYEKCTIRSFRQRSIVVVFTACTAECSIASVIC